MINATRLFSKKGFNQTSMVELAAETGLAGATIFYHFNSKEKLFLSVLENMRSQIMAAFNAYTDRVQFENGLETTLGAVGFYLDLSGRMDDQFRLLHRHHTHKFASANPNFRKHLESIYECFIQLFCQAIEKGRLDGSIGHISARKNALIIFALVDGLVRFNTYNFYDAAALYDEVLESCRKILQKRE